MIYNWRKSSYSSAEGDCVEVATLPDGGRAVRDSKDPHGPTLTFTPAQWRTFLEAVKTRSDQF